MHHCCCCAPLPHERVPLACVAPAAQNFAKCAPCPLASMDAQHNTQHTCFAALLLCPVARVWQSPPGPSRGPGQRIVLDATRGAAVCAAPAPRDRRGLIIDVKYLSHRLGASCRGSFQPAAPYSRRSRCPPAKRAPARRHGRSSRVRAGLQVCLRELSIDPAGRGRRSLRGVSLAPVCVACVRARVAPDPLEQARLPSGV